MPVCPLVNVGNELWLPTLPIMYRFAFLRMRGWEVMCLFANSNFHQVRSIVLTMQQTTFFFFGPINFFARAPRWPEQASHLVHGRVAAPLDERMDMRGCSCLENCETEFHHSRCKRQGSVEALVLLGGRWPSLYCGETKGSEREATLGGVIPGSMS